MAFAITSVVRGYHAYRSDSKRYLCLLHPSKFPLLDGRSFADFEVAASTASLAALMVTDGSVWDNGPSGSGSLLGTGLK